VAFLPVDDIDKLLGGVAGEIEADHGVYEINRDTNKLFVTQKGKWAYIARHRNALEDLPLDPLEQLRGLDQQYNLAVRINVQNIPQGMRDMAAGLIKLSLAGRARVLNGKDENPGRLHAQLARGTADKLVGFADGLDRLTLGLNIDHSSGRTYLDIEATALPGSNAAKRLAAGAQAPADSRLAGVLMPDAIFSLHVNSSLSKEDKEQAGLWLKSLRGQHRAEIDSAEDPGDAQNTKLKKQVGKLLDLLDQTIEKEGRIHFGLAAIAGPGDAFHEFLIDAATKAMRKDYVGETIIGVGKVTVVAGGLTANGAEWEDAAMKTVTMVAEGAGQDQPKLNVDIYKGWRFHVFSVMAPQTMRAEPPLGLLRNLLGNPLKIVLAFGDDTFYVAVGEKGAEAIKRAIDQSADAPAKNLPPVTASVSLAEVGKLIASESRDPDAAAIAATLRQGGNDRLKLTVEPVDGGMRYRLEGEQAVNKLLAVALGHAADMRVNLNPLITSVPSPDNGASTTPRNGGATTTTVTQTETGSGGRRISRRHVAVMRRSSSGKSPSDTKEAEQLRPAKKSTGDKKEDAPPDTAVRAWSSKSGKFKIQARFIGIDDETVRLETKDGEKVTVAIDKLSEAGQKLARQLAQEMEDDPFVREGDDDPSLKKW
jgi:hypothetical protein